MLCHFFNIKHFQLTAFSSAIDWSESWILMLLAFHCILFIAVILTRNIFQIQGAIFLCVCILVYLSENMNAYASSNYKQFSTQNYFDSQGVFAGVMFAGPLLCLALLQLVFWINCSLWLFVHSVKLTLLLVVQINMLRLVSSTLIIAGKTKLQSQRKNKEEIKNTSSQIIDKKHK